MAVVVWACPQENETRATEVELINKLLFGHAQLPQIRERSQQSLHVGVCPYFVIAYGGKDTAIHPGVLHLFIWRRQLLQHFLVDERPIWIGGRLVALSAPPHQIAGTQEKLGVSGLDVSNDFARNPLATLQAEHRAAHTR